MSEFSKLKPVARAYVVSVVVVGAIVLAASGIKLYQEPLGSRWFVLALLTLLTGSFTVRVPSTNASLSVSETFVFASVLLFGPAAGTVTVLLECLVILFWMKPQGKAVHRVLFNMAAPAVSIWVSGSVFFLFSPVPAQSAFTLQSLFLPLAGFTALYFLLNSWLVAVAVGFETGQGPLEIWWTNFTWLSVNYFSGASVAALLVTYIKDLDLSALAVIIPLLVVSYLTFRTAMGRVEDSNNHLSELNRLHLSTIETLAMAIDAKDQITHGHIRRVQAYTVGLARHVGITEQKLIKAIEAAALLHDMGKLAVPEYILNKPGKLTNAEFEKMKLHATIGADILTAIEFPYPVVPIVRHHHENWDGTGYPTGLKGTDIPIGARILSVVDCFDALTSDRPYRPRLSDDEAMRILFERRGSMYDPLIVDTFSRVYRDIAPSPPSIVLPGQVLDGITSARRPPRDSGQSSFDEIAASAEEMAAMYALGRALAGLCGIRETGDLLAKHLRRLIPFAQSVLFVYDVRTDELEAKHGFGELTVAIKGMRISLGERLSGWVAANRQVILNSDPVLDLGDVARTAQPRLRSCISAPVLCDEQLVGVLSLYAEGAEHFTENHRRVMEAVSALIGKAVKHASADQMTSGQDCDALPRLRQFEDLLTSTGSDRLRADSHLTVLLVEFIPFAETWFTEAVREGMFAQCARSVRAIVAAEDVLFRSDSDGIVIVLSNPDKSRSSRLVEQLKERLGRQVIRLETGAHVTLRPVVSRASSPSDGASFGELLSAAYGQVSSEIGVPLRSVH